MIQPIYFTKYTSAEYGFKALSEQKVCFSSPLAFNDIFDMRIKPIPRLKPPELYKKIVSNIYTHIKNKTPPDPRYFNIEYVKILKVLQVKYTSVASNQLVPLIEKEASAFIIKKINNILDELSDRSGTHFSTLINSLFIFCAEKSAKHLRAQNLLMWAHYSDNFQGIAIKFKSDIVSKKGAFGFDQMVKRPKYDLIPPDPLPPDRLVNLVLGHGNISSENFLPFLMTKNKIWDYENEIRFIRTSLNVAAFKKKVKSGEIKILEETYNHDRLSVKRRVLVPFLKNEIYEVYLGPSISKYWKARIKNIVRKNYPDVKVYSLTSGKESTFQVEFVQEL